MRPGSCHDTYASQHQLTDREKQLIVQVRDALLAPPRQEQFLQYRDLSMQITRTEGAYESLSFTTNKPALQHASARGGAGTGDPRRRPHQRHGALQRELAEPLEQIEQSSRRLGRMQDEIKQLKHRRDQSTHEVDDAG